MIDPRYPRPSRLRGGPAGLALGAAAVLLLVAACASPSATPSPEATPSVLATSPETAPPAPTATPGVTPGPTQIAGECTPGAPTDLSLDWVAQESQSGDYTFSRPADWADLSEAATIPTNSSVSPETFQDLGLAEDAQLQVDLVRSFDGSVGMSAWAIDGVTTRVDPLFDRELAWLRSQPQVNEIIDEELEWCVGGSRARGFSSTWSFPSGEVHIVIFVVQRNDTMYEMQLTANDPASIDIFHEVLNTWRWTEGAEPPPSGDPDLDDDFAATDFKVVGISPELVNEEGQDHPDESSFQTTIDATSDRIYVLYELDDGVGDTVQFSWQRDGREIVSNQFDYKESTGWAWAWINRPASGEFVSGSYQVTLTLAVSGDSITVPFTVE